MTPGREHPTDSPRSPLLDADEVSKLAQLAATATVAVQHLPDHGVHARGEQQLLRCRRYDRLVSHFIPGGTIRTVPATGFAFGVERLVHLLDRLGLLGADRRAVRVIGLSDAPADILLAPPPTAAGYLSAVRAAAPERAAGRAVDIYLGEPNRWKEYAQARGIAETRPLPIAEDRAR